MLARLSRICEHCFLFRPLSAASASARPPFDIDLPLFIAFDAFIAFIAFMGALLLTGRAMEWRDG